MFGKNTKGSSNNQNQQVSMGVASSSPSPAPAQSSRESSNQESSGSGSRTRVETLIGGATTLDGDLQFSGKLSVEGTVKGNLTANDDESVLLLSQQGRIQGEVRVPNMLLNGTVEGDVFANGKVELYESARICGDVYYNLLEMAVGAEVNGKLVRQKPTETPQAAMPLEEPSGESPEEAE